MTDHTDKWLLSPYVIEMASEDEGVYILWRNSEVVYIGATSNLQERLLDHLDSPLDPLSKNATHYWWHNCSSPEGHAAAMREEHVRVHGHLPTFNRLEKKRRVSRQEHHVPAV